MLGALDQSYLFSMLECLASGNAKLLVAEIEQLAMRSISFDITLKELAGVLSRIALVQSVGPDMIDDADAKVISALASKLRPDQVQLYYQISLLGRRDLALAPDEQCGFTMTMLRMLAFANSGGERPQLLSASAGGASSSASDVPASYAASRPRAAVVESMKETGASTKTVPAEYASPAPATIENWTEFVTELRLAGMAGMLAKQCEFQSFASGILELVVPTSQKHLADKPYQDKLRAELVPRLGANLRLNIRVADATGASLAAHEDRVRTQQQADAEGAIEQDPFIRGLRQDFGAEVLPDSVRPVGPH
jgi:DNA polymerase-3 subunit gamma/tau